MQLKQMPINIKDRSSSFIIKKAFNFYFKGVGADMLKFELDSNTKKIYLDVMLKGEKESLKVEIRNYKITVEDDKSFIDFDEVVTSREWINSLIRLYLKDKKIEIPKDKAKLFSIVA